MLLTNFQTRSAVKTSIRDTLCSMTLREKSPNTEFFHTGWSWLMILVTKLSLKIYSSLQIAHYPFTKFATSKHQLYLWKLKFQGTRCAVESIFRKNHLTTVIYRPDLSKDILILSKFPTNKRNYLIVTINK